MQPPDDERLELLAQIRGRRTLRTQWRRQIMDEASGIMRFVCLIVARYASVYQAPSRHFLWTLELRMTVLINQMLNLLAEEEVDCGVEEAVRRRME